MLVALKTGMLTQTMLACRHNPAVYALFDPVGVWWAELSIFKAKQSSAVKRRPSREPSNEPNKVIKLDD